MNDSNLPSQFENVSDNGNVALDFRVIAIINTELGVIGRLLYS